MIPSRRVGARTAHALTATILAGVLTYVILAIVSRTVDAAAFDQFSVFWSIALIVGFGFFLPVEQEAARLGQDSRARSDVNAAMMRVTAVLTVGVGVLAVLAMPLLIGVLRLSGSLVLACVLIVAASAVQFTARGRLLSHGRSGAFTNTLILDTVLRVVFLGAIAVIVVVYPGTDASGWFALALVAAIIVAHAWAVPWRSWRSDDPALVRTFRAAVMTLIVTSLCAQILVNAGPIAIQALTTTPGDAGAFQASSTLARIPLAMITPIQAMLVGPLAALTVSGDHAAVAGWMRRVAVAAVALGVVGAVAGWLIGPRLVGLIFGPQRALPGPDIALLVAGVVVHVALIIFTQAIVATNRHRSAMWTWILALLAAVAVFAASVAWTGPVLAVELGFGIGSLAGAVAALVLVLRFSSVRAARIS